MSPPVGPRPPPSLRTPPPRILTHAASAAQVATSRATPEIPPPLGGAGATWAVGNRVAPAGKGIEDTRATREGPLRTVVRDFSEVGVFKGGFGLGGRLLLKT